MKIESREKEKRTLSYYDENAAAFCEGTRNADMSEMRGRFLRYLKPGALILDVGCGSGRDSKAFIESGYRVVALDGSKEMCRQASVYLGQEVQCRRFEEIDEKEVYDGIWACASLLHVPHELLPKVIARLIAALVDGGVLYASFKYGEEEREAGGRYFTDLREDGWKKVLEEAEEEMKGSRLETVECFVTGDVREGRGEEKWLNVVGRKVMGHIADVDELLEETDLLYKGMCELVVRTKTEEIQDEIKQRGIAFDDLSVIEKARMLQFQPDNNSYDIQLYNAVCKACGFDTSDDDEIFADYQAIYEKTLEMKQEQVMGRNDGGRGRAR